MNTAKTILVVMTNLPFSTLILTHRISSLVHIVPIIMTMDLTSVRLTHGVTQAPSTSVIVL